MREIKFRAWEPELKRFYFFDLYTIYCINPMRVKPHEPDETNAMVLFNINHRPQEQFTGLKDKNGREIYEGDIVRAWCDNGPAGESLYVYSVKITEWGHNIQDWTYKEDGFLPEVIGNIHENGDLLK